jgi:hypothetical protein
MGPTWLASALACFGVALASGGTESLLGLSWGARSRRRPLIPSAVRRLWGCSRIAFGAGFMIRVAGELASGPSQQWMRSLASVEFLVFCAIGTGLGLRANHLHRLRS